MLCAEVFSLAAAGELTLVRNPNADLRVPHPAER